MASALCSSALLLDYISIISFCSCSHNDKKKTLNHHKWNSFLGHVICVQGTHIDVAAHHFQCPTFEFSWQIHFSIILFLVYNPSLPFFPKHHFDTNRERKNPLFQHLAAELFSLFFTFIFAIIVCLYRVIIIAYHFVFWFLFYIIDSCKYFLFCN